MRAGDPPGRRHPVRHDRRRLSRRRREDPGIAPSDIDSDPGHAPARPADRFPPVTTGCSRATTPASSSTRPWSSDGSPRPHYEALVNRLGGFTPAPAGRAGAGARRRVPPGRASPSPCTARARASSAPSRWTSCRGSSRPTSGRTSRRGSSSGSPRSTASSTTCTSATRRPSNDGIVPRWLVTSSDGFQREAFGIAGAPRRPLPGRRHRHRARRRRHLPRAGGQPPQPERRLLRPREPRRDDPRAARASSTTTSSARSTTTARRCSARCAA